MSPIQNFLYKLVAIAIRFILKINGGLAVVGRENIPLDSGAIIAANHISYLDPPVVGSVTPKPATFLARRGLFDIPVLGWMISPTAIAIDREKTRPSTIKEVLKRLKRNELIVIFPEGRRSETGKMLEAKRGIGMLVSMSKANIIPTLIIGTDKVLPVDAKWIKRAKTTVVFGKPIDYNSLSVSNEGDQHQLHEHISKKIMNAIKELKNKTKIELSAIDE